jgi:glycosyltransferase involved in cell wall biosynthesis
LLPGSEVFVVDDGSTDGTAKMVKSRYRYDIEDNRLVVVERPVNGGVTAAKNTGARAARGDWLVFLDSDDQLLPSASQEIPDFAARHATASVLFFRCVDEGGCAVEETLPVVARAAFMLQLYDEDLRGFEGLTYLRLAKYHAPVAYSDAVVRRYSTAGKDRLSSLAGRLRRADLMARGFNRLRAEHSDGMSFRQRTALALRIACYRLAARIV